MDSNFVFRPAVQGDWKEIDRLSQIWEDEQITYGLCANSQADYGNGDAWVCCHKGEVIGYIIGSVRRDEHVSVFPPQQDFFELDEFYIHPEFRSRGVGSDFYAYVEAELKRRTVPGIILSSATKDSMRIIGYYSKLGYSIWSVTFYKNLEEGTDHETESAGH